MSKFDGYLAKYDLDETHILLLDLIPLIEMIWVDNENQDEEINILYRFALQHLCQVEEGDANDGALSASDVNSFLDRFTQTRPDPEMLKDLRELCAERIDTDTGNMDPKKRKQAILDHCMDIAGACAQSYPYKYNERISANEKVLLTELFRAFG